MTTDEDDEAVEDEEIDEVTLEAEGDAFDPKPIEMDVEAVESTDPDHRDTYTVEVEVPEPNEDWKKLVAAVGLALLAFGCQMLMELSESVDALNATQNHVDLSLTRLVEVATS